LFVPINAAAFYFISKEKTGYGTALINLVRNVGGSCGIAFATTMLARRAQFHQSTLIDTLTPLNPLYSQAVSGAQAALIHHGVSPSLAGVQAWGLFYNMVREQAAILAYTDAFRIMGVISLAAIPLMFVLKKVKGGGPAPGMH
jgi:DHA2 family multidrug resistance protein